MWSLRRGQLGLLLTTFLTVLIICSQKKESQTLKTLRNALFEPGSDATRSRQPRCTPDKWSEGRWRRKSEIVQVIEPGDAYAASGFTGCACNVNKAWHLGYNEPTELEWRTNVSAYEWVPGAGCEEVPKDYAEHLLVNLIQQGGWLLIGDSVTQEHFFSLSCILWPHIVNEPNRAGKLSYGWPQHLHLNPESPLVQRTALPKGWNITTTPIVSFRRADLLFEKDEIEAFHRNTPVANHFKSGEDFTLFGPKLTFNVAAREYLTTFLSALPDANYRTLLLSTAGHWEPELFVGLEGSHQKVLELFIVSVSVLLDMVVEALDSDVGRGKHVVYRPYLPGDPGCRAPQVLSQGPLDGPTPEPSGAMTWIMTPIYNRVMHEAIEQRSHPRIHYLAIDRPARLRPDAHVTSDCLHITVGSGVIEGWSQYIHYYLSNSDW